MLCDNLFKKSAIESIDYLVRQCLPSYYLFILIYYCEKVPKNKINHTIAIKISRSEINIYLFLYFPLSLGLPRVFVFNFSNYINIVGINFA